MEIQQIWPRETGILDLPDDWQSLSVATMRELEREWSEEKGRMGPNIQQFTVELNREWAIETGQIENLYDLERGVTLTLIEQGFDAAVIPHGGVNKDPEYVRNLLQDQEHALEGLFSFVRQESSLTVGYIKELHAAMTRSQASVTAFTADGQPTDVPMLHGDWKKSDNFPRRNGTIYKYCPPEHTAAEMDRLVELHHQHQAEGVAPEVEAAWLHHRFTQIHPFQDGNGRVARALATLVFIRANLFPLVVSRDDKDNYLETLERADAGDLGALVLMMVRLQQQRHRRALVAIARSSPPPDTLREAVLQYAEVLRNRDAAAEARKKGGLVKITAWTGEILQNIISSEVPLIRQADESASIGTYVSGVADEAGILKRVKEEFQLEVDLIASTNGLNVQAPPHLWRISLIAAPLKHDLDGRIVSFAVLLDEHKLIQTLGRPHIWSKAEMEGQSAPESMKSWITEVLKLAFPEIARRTS